MIVCDQTTYEADEREVANVVDKENRFRIAEASYIGTEQSRSGMARSLTRRISLWNFLVDSIQDPNIYKIKENLKRLSQLIYNRKGIIYINDHFIEEYLCRKDCWRH